jgi:hypothetical protein
MRALKGAIAYCSRGEKGFILEDYPKLLTYPDGSTGHAWVGVHLGPDKIGRPWSSRSPRVLRKLTGISSTMIMFMINKARKLHGLPTL